MLMLNDLKDNYQNLYPDEKKIYDSRMIGISVQDMNESEVRAATTGIIFKISVICGCQVPTNELHIDALEQEFMVFLKEYGYDYLTVEEIITAFRMNANFRLPEKIETYGALFNIDYASKVLKQYSTKRYQLDNKLSDVYREMETQKILAEEENNRRLKIINQFELFQKDEKAELDLANCYMQLVHDGAFKDNKADQFFMDKAIADAPRGDENEFNKRLRIAGIDYEAAFLAGKMTVRYLFEQMKKSGRLKVYNEKMELLHPGFEMPDLEMTNSESAF
jgi:hypothetical protein